MSTWAIAIAFLALLVPWPVMSGMERLNVAMPAKSFLELPVIAAMRNRYYHSEGLEIQRIQIDAAIAVKSLVGGEVEILLGWEAPVGAALTGLPVRIVAATMGRPLHVLIARPEIRTPGNLKGKAVGIDAAHSLSDYLSRVALRHLGLLPEKNVDLVDIGTSSQRMAALAAGEIQATALDIGLAAAMVDQGYRPLVNLGDIIDLPVFGIAVSATDLVADRDRIRRFIKATLRGGRFIKRNRADSLRMMQSYLRFTPSQSAKVWDASARYLTDDGFVLDRAVALSVRRARETLDSANRASWNQLTDWTLIRELAAERSKIPSWLKQYDP